MSFVCHRRPDRSLHLRGKPLPLCARCTGFYVAIPAGLVLAVVLQLHHDASYFAWLLLTLFAVSPMALDGLTQLPGTRTSSNGLRVATGLLAGLVIGADLVVIALSG